MRPLRRTGLALAVVAVLAVATVMLAAATSADSGAGSPAATLRSFLINASVDQAGVEACRYLNPHARAQLERAEPPHTSCEIALSAARLRLGDENVDSEAAVKGLSYRVEQQGDVARVTVGAHGAERAFTLRKATSQERDEFRAPPTSWRVDSGVDALVAPATAHR
jgi:hypothetical protein